MEEKLRQWKNSSQALWRWLQFLEIATIFNGCCFFLFIFNVALNNLLSIPFVSENIDIFLCMQENDRWPTYYDTKLIKNITNE